MTLKVCLVFLASIFFFFYFLYKLIGLDTKTHSLTRISFTQRCKICFLALEAPKRGHVLRLFAWDAPVVGLVDGFVVLPGRLVVHGEPLDGLGGQSLRRED